MISSPLALTVPLRGEAQKEGSHRVRTAQGFKTRNQCLLFKGSLNFPKIRYSFYFPCGSLPVSVFVCLFVLGTQFHSRRPRTDRNPGVSAPDTGWALQMSAAMPGFLAFLTFLPAVRMQYSKLWGPDL